MRLFLFLISRLVACVRVGLNEVVLVSHQPLCFRGERFTNKSVICTWFGTNPREPVFMELDMVIKLGLFGTFYGA
jgi:hypothetical protein